MIRTEKANFPITVLCSVLKVSRSGYYAWLKRPPSLRKRENDALVVKIEEIYKTSRKSYGSPRVHEALVCQGYHVGENRVARLMHDNGIAVIPSKRFRRTTDSNHTNPIAPNLLNRCFTASMPDMAWVADITYVWTVEGWLYLAVILDLFSRRVIGWAMDDNMRTGLVMDAFNMALGQRNPETGLIHHSDRGSQYASDEYREALEIAGMQCSMSRKGNCWDNAVAESFFGTLEVELRCRFNWMRRSEAKLEIFEYIEVFYNRQRMHSTLGYKTPVEYERLFKKKDTKAA